MQLTREEIESIGFAYVGKDVRITRFALFFNPQRIHIGDRSRIDEFAIVSAGEEGVFLGRNVHVSAHTVINGSGGRVVMDDFSGIAPNVCLWTASDDYTGGSLTNGTIPFQYKNNTVGPVTLGRHVIVGTGSIILPNVHLHDGASVGALSLVMRDVAAGDVVFGSPARRVRTRSLETLKQSESQYLEAIGESSNQP
jgi:galactoside O-acetyltransferase